MLGDMENKIWKIPVSWESYGTVEIKANSLEEAIFIFDETIDDLPLPDDSNYVDASFKRSDFEFCKLINWEK